MTKRIALGGIMASLAVVVTHALAFLPNVELTSLTLFTAGRLLGPWMGMACGVVSTLGFSLTNPVGPPDPLLLATQCLGWASWGALGGMAVGLGLSRSRLLLALATIVQTLFFQTLVNCSFVAVYGVGPRETLLLAMPWVVLHVLSNVGLFVLLVPVLEDRLVRTRSCYAVPR